LQKTASKWVDVKLVDMKTEGRDRSAKGTKGRKEKGIRRNVRKKRGIQSRGKQDELGGGGGGKTEQFRALLPRDYVQEGKRLKEKNGIRIRISRRRKGFGVFIRWGRKSIRNNLDDRKIENDSIGTTKRKETTRKEGCETGGQEWRERNKKGFSGPGIQTYGRKTT